MDKCSASRSTALPEGTVVDDVEMGAALLERPMLSEYNNT